MPKRSMEYLEAAVIAYFWYLYFKYRDSYVYLHRRKAKTGWDNFRKHGIAFVKLHGDVKARELLSNFLSGAEPNKRGPIHYLLQDR